MTGTQRICCDIPFFARGAVGYDAAAFSYAGSVLVMIKDRDGPESLTNTIEYVATAAMSLAPAGTDPASIRFVQVQHHKGEKSYTKVDLSWSDAAGRYCNPRWAPLRAEEKSILTRLTGDMS